VPPAAAIHTVPIVGGDFEERALAQALDHQALNQAAASLYRDRFDSTPGIVYAAGVDHAYNLAKEFRAAGLKAEAVSGRTPPVKLAEILAAYERGEIDVLINAMLLAEGWNSPRATVCMHLAPTASKRVYQQRIGRIMRIHGRKEAGIVVDFVPKAATHNERVVSLHSLLDSDFYREGARVTPAPRRRQQRRARRKLSPASWLVPVTADVKRRLGVIMREWQRIDPRFLDEDEQRYWATIAGRNVRFDERVEFAKKFTEGGASKAALETFLSTCAAENSNRRLRMTALADRVSMRVDRADFDDLVTLVTQAPTWDKDRVQGVRILLQPGGLDTVAPLTPGPLDLHYRLDAFDLKLAFGPTDFVQVNAAINQSMVARAIELLEVVPTDRVLDLYCGLGNFTLPLARHAAEVVGVEGDAGLIGRARANAAANGISNAQFHVGDLSVAPDKTLPWMRGGYDKVLLDPPRVGAREVLSAVAHLAPRRLVYISCHTGSLARDLGVLTHELGFRLRAAGVLDMFPHTTHVESMAVLDRP
jgi:precorrin-6B methylase 2